MTAILVIAEFWAPRSPEWWMYPVAFYADIFLLQVATGR